MKRNFLILALSALLCGFVFMSFQQQQGPQVHDYVQISYLTGGLLDRVTISFNGIETKVEKADDGAKYGQASNAGLRAVKIYEAQGYKLISSAFAYSHDGAATYNYLMQK